MLQNLLLALTFIVIIIGCPSPTERSASNAIKETTAAEAQERTEQKQRIAPTYVAKPKPKPKTDTRYAPYQESVLREKVRDLATAESVIYRSQRYFWKGTLSPERAAKRMASGVRQIGLEKAAVVARLAEDDHKKNKPMQ